MNNNSKKTFALASLSLRTVQQSKEKSQIKFKGLQLSNAAENSSKYYSTLFFHSVVCKWFIISPFDEGMALTRRRLSRLWRYYVTLGYDLAIGFDGKAIGTIVRRYRWESKLERVVIVPPGETASYRSIDQALAPIVWTCDYSRTKRNYYHNFLSRVKLNWLKTDWLQPPHTICG